MASRMPFTLNTIVLLPFLRSVPPAAGVSVLMTLLAMTGLDFGILRLGHPDTAADELVALIMSFSVVSPLLWGIYMIASVWQWASGFFTSAEPRREPPVDRSDAGRFGK
jgi:hypothetical protein